MEIGESTFVCIAIHFFLTPPLPLRHNARDKSENVG
mgnify:CR=1 FL=1